ncbi:SoxR reducing system RseC family protein [Thioalkalicoccus limnaeus]|uniref:SoxR reducing system RseC family protein n=1 Tax=Thioalkalicoccus limnaeus TaxID=120681 RepID=A0ABV4BG31_9GAMM
MIEQTGRVVRRDGDVAEIETERRTSCGHCSVNTGCGIALLDRFLGRRRQCLMVLNPIGAELGQRVVIGIPEASLLSASVAAYLAPILALIGGALVAQWLAGWIGAGGGETIGVLGGLLGLVAGLAWLAHFSRQHAGDPRYRAVILRLDRDGSSIPQIVSLDLSATGPKGP